MSSTGWRLFDPDRYYSVAAERLGQPDLTILRALSSVQGYGAVVDANYDRGHRHPYASST